MADESSSADRGLGTGMLDLALGACLVTVPLAFSTSVREFLAFKAVVLEALVGLAALLAAVAMPRALVGSRAIGIACAFTVYVAATMTMNPTADGLAAAAYLVAWAVLAALLWVRASHFRRSWLLAVVGLPLAVDLCLSLLQGAGVGVLPATAAAFGSIHGALVGTIGNPNENCWYLLLAGVLLVGVTRDSAGTWLPRLALAVAASVAVVIVLDRSRAALLAGSVVLALCLARNHRSGMYTLAVAAVTIGLGMAWHADAAIQGRIFLATVALGMVAARGGVPAGPGAFARDFPSAQAEVLARHPELAHYYSQIDHAHLDIAELVYELGPPVLVIGGIVVSCVFRSARSAQALPKAARGALVASVVLSLLGYPLFSPASATVLALALAIACGGPSRRERPVRATVMRLVLALVGLGLAGLAVRQCQAERALTRLLAGSIPASAEDAARLWPDADRLFYVGNFRARSDDAAAILAYEASFARRPRHEVAHNLETVHARREDTEAAEHWRTVASWLGPPPKEER